VAKSNAIVTLVVGDKYKHLFYKYSFKSFVKYAEKVGADLIVIDKQIDLSEKSKLRSIAWQKLLILSQEWSDKYNQILWVDSDIVINNINADNIFETTPVEKIGGVDAYKIPNKIAYQAGLERLYAYWDKQGVDYIRNLTPHDYYLNRDISTKNSLDSVLHTGVFLCSPKHHKDIFINIYSQDTKINEAFGNYEMPLMSARLIEAELVHWINHKFNYCVNEIIASEYPELIQKDYFFRNIKLKKVIKEIYLSGNFIHFAGCTNNMKYLGNLFKN